ncbi:anti-sigma factor [Methylosinus sp. Sm6]|uniref:anti-sigma factor family protein n=1 Tax=Methylosinus sp. Sm6 TaxID=2866948 RepID=UPI001C992017|nr:anti-sigma factor [Methylosinus sp. Sm6]MBY6242387.1 anti-sigma factor [Methylosinus sp. Sm6]
MRADPVDESDLHAYVDGELEPDERRRIEDHLHKHQEDAALVEGWRRQNAALRAAFAHTIKEPLPPALRSVTKSGLSGSFGSGVNWARFSPSKASSLRTLRRPDTSRKMPRRPMIAMSLLTLSIGALVAGAALLAFTSPAAPPVEPAAARGPAFIERAEIAYRTFASDERPVELGADRAAELSQWLADRVGFGALPDLTAAGLELRGGRLTPGAQGPAGLLFYRSAAGALVAFYFERAMGERASGPPPRATPGLEAVEWRAGGRAFALLGPLDAEALRAAAEIAERSSR